MMAARGASFGNNPATARPSWPPNVAQETEDRGVQTRVGSWTILSVPIEHCDRRALSEAWYSALRAPHSTARLDVPHARPQASVAAKFTRIPATRTHAHSEPQGVRGGSSRLASFSGGLTERPTVRPSLACRIVGTFFLQKKPPRQASFRLGDGKTRVHVLLRTADSAIYMVAVCSTAARSVVAQALKETQARLGAQGLRLRSALAVEIPA